MAVVVQCYHCNTILELDEGFRGGVCRCSTCGSLLQVPKASSGNAPRVRPAAPVGSAADGPRPASPVAAAGLSRGGFDARANQGSGVRPAVRDPGGSGLRQARPAAPVATAPRPGAAEKSIPVTGPTRPGAHLNRVRKNNVLLYLGITLIVIITVVVVIVGIKMVLQQEPLGTRDHPAGAGPGAPGGDSTGAAEVAPQERTKGFFGVPLAGKRILLSIDAASSMNDGFDFVRNGVYHAVESLEAGQEIRVALWKGQSVKVIPADFMGKAGLKDLQRQLSAVASSGSSDAQACMKASLALGADQVIFVTAKVGLEPEIAEEVYKGGGGAVRFDGIKIESVDSPSPLEILATKSGGTYRLLTTAQLDQLSR